MSVCIFAILQIECKIVHVCNIHDHKRRWEASHVDHEEEEEEEEMPS
jgi:hypothetical protein